MSSVHESPVSQVHERHDGAAADSAGRDAPAPMMAAAASLGTAVLRSKLARRLQRRAGHGVDDNGVSTGADQAVSVAASGVGAPLPEAVQRKFEGSLGADLGGVRVHTGAASADAADALGARAYTTGQDIHFGRGEYDPRSTAGQELLAHEVAHTVQQAGGASPAVQSKLEVSTPGDALEVEADRAAGAMVHGQPAHVSGGAAVARKVIQRNQQGPSVGDAGTATFLSDGAGDTVASGEAGFSRRMLLETSGAAEGLASAFAGYQLQNVAPDLSGIEAQLRQRAAEKQRQVEKANDFFNTPSTTATYTNAAAWCQGHMEQIEQDRAAEQEKFTAYNAWVPRANGFYTSAARLQAQQEMLGAGDTQAMTQQLLSGLSDAGQVAARAQAAQDRGQGGALPVPPSDNSLAQFSAQTTQAAREMNTAYLGFQRNILSDRQSEINHEGDQARERLQQINEVKQFVRNVGQTIDVTMSVVQGAPAAIATATETVQRAGAQIGAARNQAAARRGERQTHNPTYVTSDEDGNMVVRNVQTGQDRNLATGERSDSPAGGGISLPTSVSDLLGSIADFAYASEVRSINSQLEQIKSRCDAVRAVIDMSATREAAQRFQDKLNDFALKCNQLQQRMAQRRQQYLEFGVSLDNFARRDQASQRAGQGVGATNERYATIMTVVSQVREVVAVGRGAQSGFEQPAQLRSWAESIFLHRERADSHRTDIPPLQLPPGELNALTAMYSQVNRFHGNVRAVLQVLGPVDAQAATVMGGLNQGAGGAPGGGQY